MLYLTCMKRCIFSLIIFFYSIKYIDAQTIVPFNVLPITNTIAITGNYGELRAAQFHLGLDFKTFNQIDWPIYSVLDGYVSRIKISQTGYGNALYITHFNGFTTVYAHQNKFALKIENYIKKYQYKHQLNELDIQLNFKDLPIQQHEIIGYTGNSGSSTGPHLHYEIRKTNSETPINPLLFYQLKDSIPPSLNYIVVYNMSDTNNPTPTHFIDAVKNMNIKVYQFETPFAVGFSGFDNKFENYNGIYDIKILLDQQLRYHHQFNAVDFYESMYVKYFCEELNNFKIQKCFNTTPFDIKLVKKNINKGIINITDTLIHQLKFIAIDEAQQVQQCELNFKIKSPSNANNQIKKTYNVFVNQFTEVELKNIKIYAKPNTFSKMANLVELNKPNKIITIEDVNNEPLPIAFKPYAVSLKINKPIENKTAYLVMKINKEINIGNYANGWFTTNTFELGSYSCYYDTIAPVIDKVYIEHDTALNIKIVKFQITELLSGLDKYEVLVNGKWEICLFDLKSQILSCSLPFNNQNKPRIIEISLSDRVGNRVFKKYSELELTIKNR